MDKLAQLNKLTSLRYIAAIYVVAFHNSTELKYFGQLTQMILHHGYVAVSFFFVLSGYILTYSYYNKAFELNRKQFLKKRFIKLYPAYIVALLISLVFGIYFYINAKTTHLSLFIDVYAVVSSILMIQSWTPNVLNSVMNVNGPGWSLSVEIFLYLIYPISLLIIAKKSNRFLKNAIFIYGGICLFIIILFAISTRVANYSNIENDYNPSAFFQRIQVFPLSHLPQFLIGVIMSVLVHRAEIRNNTIFSIFFYSSLVLLLILLSINIVPGYLMNNGILAIVFCIIIIKAHLSTKINILDNKLFVKLGEASYHLYIFAWPVSRFFSILYNKINITNSLVLQFFIYLIALSIFSVYTYSLENKIKTLFINK